ncbi:heme o synthase [Marinibactrum halimedae]|uniref:Protoheme IX farnesyltransferase n=1 Tax=Marinibactrum halimedae TaxID=1444977 RepID=A0AA37T851_9GAMM|nr:heme o synthase [Marinibactrum halimedae]MCD9461054.1 heme o synthase [Marinibactrum halimedae]GLS24432.1 protoheme IX farnesyltransferase 1 [Marinibactrum halimedae]
MAKPHYNPVADNYRASPVTVFNVLTHWRDFLELCKPKVVALMLLTSLIGMLLASNAWISITILFWGNIGIALCAGSAAAVNHVVDRHIDAKMSRTDLRPVATGRVTPEQAITFAVILGILGAFILWVFINTLTAWLTLASLVGYALVYTLFLKRATPQNIVIGGLAGAAPPLLGWTAVTGSIDGHGLLLVLIIFAWTPPHFWALAVHRKEEYAKANIPMLPVTHGERYTKIHIFLYTLILLMVSLLPYATGMLNWLYLIGALVLGIGFLYWAMVMLMSKGKSGAMSTFKYSIWYLMILFIVMLIDHYAFPVDGLW